MTDHATSHPTSGPAGGASGRPVGIVTGAGSGIGRAASVALAAAGFHVVLAGRTERTLAATRELTGGRGETMVLDVTRAADVRAAFAAVAARHGRIDLLVNNAGTAARPVPVDEVGDDDWARVIGVNLNGAFHCARAAFAAMRRQTPQGGRILNIGSVSSYVPRPMSVAYTASKHAVTGLTKALSLDGRPYGIACGQIDVGNAATPMTETIAAGTLQADGSLRAEPTIDPRHVAAAITQAALLPLDTNIQFMTVMATTMPYIGRG
jgi:NAD(P)-dependent dehydrogenase (short-subunit alcohol dehydrogenase family)